MKSSCTLCSILDFIFNCGQYVFGLICDHPLLLFIFSTIIATILIGNIHYGAHIASICTNGSEPVQTSRRKTAVVSAPSAQYDYGFENGPHTWDTPATNQSPINIIDEQTRRLPIRELLKWNHYEDLPTSVRIENTGHTVLLRASFGGNRPTICGADLLATYSFVEIRFRWSIINSEGSEHMHNFRKYPLEIQAMHRTGPPDCTSSYDLLIVAYFYEVTTSHNAYLEPVIQNLHRIREPCTHVEIPPFPLSYLCYQFRNCFYSYAGSLTEPPCYEGVEWFVYPEPLTISERQINEFRELLSQDGVSRIIRNARPIQPLTCSRVVNFNFYSNTITSRHQAEKKDCPEHNQKAECANADEDYE